MDEEMMGNMDMLEKLKILQALRNPDVFVTSVKEANKLFDQNPEPEKASLRREIVEYILDEDNNVWGNPDEYHNFIMALFRDGDYYSAVQVCLYALRLFPENCDLLAGMIRALGKGGDFELGEEYLERAGQIEKTRWSPRLFLYAIDFLMDKIQAFMEKPAELFERAYALTDAYVAHFPFDERGYNQRAELLILENRREEAIRELRRAINEVKPDKEDRHSSLVSAQCCVTLLDLLEESNDYALIIDVANKGLLHTTQSQPKSHIGYFSYRKALALDAAVIGEDFSNPSRIKEALHAYQTAYDLNQGRSYSRTIEQRHVLLWAHTDKKDNVSQLIRRPLFIEERDHVEK